MERQEKGGFKLIFIFSNSKGYLGRDQFSGLCQNLFKNSLDLDRLSSLQTKFFDIFDANKVRS